MSMQPVLSELWISLHPTNSKIRITGSCPKYQQQVIFRLIEEFGLNTLVHIQPPPTRELGRVPFVQKRLEQCMFLGYDLDYLIIQYTPRIMTPRKYRYNWTEGASFPMVVLHTRGRG